MASLRTMALAGTLAGLTALAALSCSEGIEPPTDTEEVLIPGGAFWMGSETDAYCDVESGTCQGAGECYNDQQVRRCVVVPTFKMDVTEVTNIQYDHCVARGGCEKPRYTNSGDYDDYRDESRFDEHPVVQVTYAEAQKYCAWRGKRLPTEAEWEYAAKGGSEQRIYPWGNDTPRCNCDIATLKANYLKCTTAAGIDEASTLGGPTRVASDLFRGDVSAHGVHDLAGNVREWVEDWHSDTGYCVSDELDLWDCDPEDTSLECQMTRCRERPEVCFLSCFESGAFFCMGPTDDTVFVAPSGPEEGTQRVTRGGAFDTMIPCRLQASYRQPQLPDKPSPKVGFRCVRDLLGEGMACSADEDCTSGVCDGQMCTRPELPTECAPDPLRSAE